MANLNNKGGIITRFIRTYSITAKPVILHLSLLKFKRS